MELWHLGLHTRSRILSWPSRPLRNYFRKGSRKRTFARTSRKSLSGRSPASMTSSLVFVASPLRLPDRYPRWIFDPPSRKLLFFCAASWNKSGLELDAFTNIPFLKWLGIQHS